QDDAATLTAAGAQLLSDRHPFDHRGRRTRTTCQTVGACRWHSEQRDEHQAQQEQPSFRGESDVVRGDHGRSSITLPARSDGTVATGMMARPNLRWLMITRALRQVQNLDPWK